MKIGVFGGTFDPIHNMHLKLALTAKEELKLDRVMLITSADPPHKDKTQTSGEIRHKMVELAAEDNDKLVPSRMELDRDGKSYTLYTLRELREKYPDDEIFFVVGGDSLSYLDKWYHAKEFMKLCTFAVYPRGKDSGFRLWLECLRLRLLYGTKTVILKAGTGDVSSTEIREKIAKGEDVSGLIPEKVLNYIKENKLYLN